MLGSVVMACSVVFTEDRFPVLFVVMPFVLLATFRLGALGAACAVVVVPTASGLATILHTGPIALVDGIPTKLTILQLFVATSFVSALPVAAALVQRERLAAALRESEALRASITDNIRDVVSRADRLGPWSFLNPAWEELTGRSVVEGLGRPVTELISVEDLAARFEQFRAPMAGESSELQTCLQFRHRNGQLRWIDTTNRRQADENGQTVGTIGSIRDITEPNAAAPRLIPALTVCS